MIFWWGVFNKIGFIQIFWNFYIRTPGYISTGEEQNSFLKLSPSIIYLYGLWRGRESSCKQTEEIEHRHSTFELCVYHRLYILHWLCLKISRHIQTTAAVCAWTVSARCASWQKSKLVSQEKGKYRQSWKWCLSTVVNSMQLGNQPGCCVRGVRLSKVTKPRCNHVYLR